LTHSGRLIHKVVTRQPVQWVFGAKETVQMLTLMVAYMTHLS